MTLLNLTGLETALEQPTPITGQVTVEYVAGRRGYVEIDGERLILPKTITVAIVNGVPVEPLELVATRGVCAARITVSAVSGAYKRRDVAIPDQPTVDYGDLVDVDAMSFAPVDVTPTLVETIDQRVAQYNAENPADPEAIADAVSDYLTENPVDGVTEEVLEATIASHAESETPHPVYDDMPSLTIIFDNALV